MSSVPLAAESAPFPSALFRVFGEADPALLPRIVALFAKCGLVPSLLHAECLGEEMLVEVEFASMSPSRADHFAEVLRQVPVVSLVHLRRSARLK
jgi:hypothetical protein